MYFQYLFPGFDARILTPLARSWICAVTTTWTLALPALVNSSPSESSSFVLGRVEVTVTAFIRTTAPMGTGKLKMI